MRGLQVEYICKGIFLGLLFFAALQARSWADTETVALCLLAGLGISLTFAGLDKVRAGYRIQGRLAAFFFFLLLESPTLVYTGILLGLAVGAKLIGKEDQGQLLAFSVVGGAAVGFVFWLVRHLRNKWARFAVILALAAGIPAAGIYWLHVDESLLPDRIQFGYQLLVGIPFFYILTFAGRAEESEAEIGAMCAALGAGMYLINLTPNLAKIQFIFPLAIFYVYTVRYLPKLRVFKHALRGRSYANIGRHRQALQAFRRALDLDPRNKLAREGLWSVHRSMDLQQVERDPEMLALVDVNVCLDRASSVLLAGKPPAAKMQEALHLLKLVERQQPGKRPVVQYWRCVAHLHEQQYDQAAEELKSVVDPAGYEAHDPERRSVLFQAWQLAVMLHPEMQKRVGGPQLAVPGRRMEAIVAVERHLQTSPEDPGAWDMKRVLYSSLTEADYAAAVGEGRAAVAFDHAYAQQLGLALINDPNRWQRGSEYLRIAARGMPATGPSIYTQIAQANQRGGNLEAALQHYLLAQRVGRSVGPGNLSAEEQVAYFAAVKVLGESAAARGDLDTAIENYHLYTENERSGIETLRTLASLYEKKQDQRNIGNAIRAVELALVYDAKDKDLLEKKDRYYYSLEPPELQSRLDSLGKAFDVEYCIAKARTILDGRYGEDSEQEMLHWALHLTELAKVVRPQSVAVRWLGARARLRRGERDEAVTILEGIRNNPQEKMSGDDADAWFEANRRLGYLYLDELSRPDLAIPCFNEFRKSAKSGADSLYRLGQAHEAIGDLAKAKRYYEQVTAYEQHPLAPDARDALYRLQSSGVGGAS